MEYNVLIAEDDESIVELLTLYLNSNGFNVISQMTARLLWSCCGIGKQILFW